MKARILGICPDGSLGIEYDRPDGSTAKGRIKDSLQDGQSMQPGGTYIGFEAKEDGSLEVDEPFTIPGGTPSSSGPAKVTTKAYRNGFDAIWGKKNLELN